MSKDLPRTYRDESHPEIYRDPKNKDKLSPDMVPPTVQGYFRIPAIWVGAPPASESKYDNDSYSEIVSQKKFSCGIFAYALRDGTFLFDFTDSDVAPVTIIPGFSYPNSPKPWKVIPQNSEAYWLAEERAILRSRLLNVHQLFLSTSRRKVDKTSAAMGYPVSPWNMIDSISRSVPARTPEIADRMRDLSARVLNMHYLPARPEMFKRQTISLECVEESFNLLDELATRRDVALISILEEAYKVGWHDMEGRFGESLIGAWTACEQIISIKWLTFLDANGVTGKRKRKLTGNDYAIAQKIEFLHLAESISTDLYDKLEIARKSRNDWVHKMIHPKRTDISTVTSVLEALISQQYGFHVKLSTTKWSGVPAFPYWTFERYRAK